MKGYGDRVRIAERLTLMGAWYAGLLSHDFKPGCFPSLADTLGDDPTEARMSGDQMDGLMNLWAVAEDPIGEEGETEI